MKLRNKLLYVVLASLLVQVIATGTFTILTFLNQARESSQKDLAADWQRASDYFERIKHSSFTHLISLSRYVQSNWQEVENARSIIRTIASFQMDIDADRIITLDREYRITADVHLASPPVLPDIKEILATYPFSYPTNRFIYLPKENEERRLYLVTGTRIPDSRGDFNSVFLIKSIDHEMITTLSMEIGISLAFFVGGHFICSDIPRFELPKPLSADDTRTISTSTGTYNLLSRIYSTDIDEKLHLVILESTLTNVLYTGQLIRSFSLAFLFTLLLSTVLAITMTTYFTSPFSKLQSWMEHYMQTGTLERLRIHRRDEVGFLTATFHTLADKLIKEEKLIKQQLEEISFLHSYNENILKSLQAGVIVVDSEGRIEYYNDFISQLIGSGEDEVRGIQVLDFLNRYFRMPDGEEFPVEFAGYPSLKQDVSPFSAGKDVREDGASAAASSSVQLEKIDFHREHAERRLFTAKMIPLRPSDNTLKKLIVLEDITGVERFWTRMAQVEKIMSLGLLSAGVAHEINNPLGSILSHVQYLSAVERDRDKIDSLRWIEKETERIAGIVQRLLSFARSEEGRDGSCRPWEAVEEICSFLKRELEKKSIRVIKNHNGAVPPVRLSEGSMKQILLNLILNAIQAVKPEGTIIITLDNRQETCRLRIEDNGIGIQQEEMKYIFDPFYTTKKAEAGTGLGLSICYSIVSRAGGDIQIRSIPAKGTCVEVILPAQAERGHEV